MNLGAVANLVSRGAGAVRALLAGGLSVLAVTAAWAGCGAATPRDAHARHADIQRHEADLERALVEGARIQQMLAEHASEAECSALAEAVTEAGEAAGRVCDVAREVRDADASVRCERARRRAADSTAGWSRCERPALAEAPR